MLKWDVEEDKHAIEIQLINRVSNATSFCFCCCFVLLLYGDFFVFYIRPTDRVRAHVFLIFARRQLPEEKENRRKNLEPGFYCHVYVSPGSLCPLLAEVELLQCMVSFFAFQLL